MRPLITTGVGRRGEWFRPVLLNGDTWHTKVNDNRSVWLAGVLPGRIGVPQSLGPWLRSMTRWQVRRLCRPTSLARVEETSQGLKAQRAAVAEAGKVGFGAAQAPRLWALWLRPKH